MSLHRFDLDDAAKEANDRREATKFRPASLLLELLFWAITAAGTVLVVILVMWLAIVLQGGQ